MLAAEQRLAVQDVEFARDALAFLFEFFRIVGARKLGEFTKAFDVTLDAFEIVDDAPQACSFLRDRACTVRVVPQVGVVELRVELR